MIIPRRWAYYWLFFWTGMMIAHGAFGQTTFEVTPITGTGHRQECHQLVCRTCWHEAGKVRCGQPRIVR